MAAKRPRFESTIGGRIVFFDIFTTIIVAWAALLIVPSDWDSPYIYTGANWTLLPPLFLAILFTKGVGELLSSATGNFRSALRLLPRLGLKGHLAILAAFAATCFYYNLFELHRNRYDAVQASEDLGGTFIALLLNFFKTYFSTRIFLELAEAGAKRLPRIYWIAVTVGMSFVIDGMAHIMLLGIFAVYAFAPGVYAAAMRGSRSVRVAIALGLPIVVAFLLLVAMSWKGHGRISVPDLAQQWRDLLPQFYWLITRLSSLFVSANAAAASAFNDVSFFLAGWRITSAEFLYRACVLLSTDTCTEYRDEFSSVSRFNFHQILFFDNGRGGASPGVLGSALYLSPWILSGCVAGLYYALIATLINAAISPKKHPLRILFLIVATYLLRNLFLNPASFFNPISAPFVGLVATLLAMSQSLSRSANHEISEPKSLRQRQPA